jgi:hypothetical protein
MLTMNGRHHIPRRYENQQAKFSWESNPLDFRGIPARARRLREDSKDATSLPGGASRWLLVWRLGYSAAYAGSVKLHGASPWHLWPTTSLCVAATVNLHQASWWHPRSWKRDASVMFIRGCDSQDYAEMLAGVEVARYNCASLVDRQSGAWSSYG